MPHDSAMLSALQLLSMADGRIQQKTKNTPYKHAIVAYSGANQ
jgi:hypothetical protein